MNPAVERILGLAVSQIYGQKASEILTGWNPGSETIPAEFSLKSGASNGQAVVEVARLLNPDLVLMDINIPACSGLEQGAPPFSPSLAARLLKEFSRLAETPEKSEPASEETSARLTENKPRCCRWQRLV